MEGVAKILSLSPPGQKPDLICLSHLRWNFVFQRPQHLLTRCARERRVFFFEEPLFRRRQRRGSSSHATHRRRDASRCRTCRPGLPAQAIERELPACCSTADRARSGSPGTSLWYYTPMALAFTDHLRPAAIVYDCMDELSAFRRRAAGVARARSSELLSARRRRVHRRPVALRSEARTARATSTPFPSSVDVAHFARARTHRRRSRRSGGDPAPAARVLRRHRRAASTIDLARRASPPRGPDWQFVLIGPVVKIDPAIAAARRRTSTTSGRRATPSCRAYIAGWDVAMLPFARNDATRFISPTKTPEYLAAGKPVVSTSIRDVVRPYGEQGLVRIADTAGRFRRGDRGARCAEDRAAARCAPPTRSSRSMSWDGTWAAMRALVRRARRRSAPQRARRAHPPRRRPRSRVGRRVAQGASRCSIIWSSAPASPAACSPSGWRRTPARRC